MIKSHHCVSRALCYCKTLELECLHERGSDINWGLKQPTAAAVVACSFPADFMTCRRRTGFVLFGHARLTNSLSIPSDRAEIENPKGGSACRAELVRRTEHRCSNNLRVNGTVKRHHCTVTSATRAHAALPACENVGLL